MRVVLRADVDQHRAAGELEQRRVRARRWKPKVVVQSWQDVRNSCASAVRVQVITERGLDDLLRGRVLEEAVPL
jgi:hypothetical protein